MTLRAIFHQIVIVIQSTFDGSIARHPHGTVDLLFSCCVMNQHQTISMHPLTNFHRSNNRHTRQRPKPRLHSSQKCHDFASIIAFATPQLPLWPTVFLASVQPPFWCSCDFYRCSTVAVFVACWQLVACICSHVTLVGPFGRCVGTSDRTTTCLFCCGCVLGSFWTMNYNSIYIALIILRLWRLQCKTIPFPIRLLCLHGSCGEVRPTSSHIGRIFQKYSAQIWSTDQHTMELIWFKMRGRNRMGLLHSDSIMSPMYRV